MKFVNYKSNLKQIRDEYEQYKIKLQKFYESYSLPAADNNNLIEFRIDDNKSIKADKLILSSKCDYFNLLLNGNFYESVNNLKEISLLNIQYECLKFIFDLLRCRLVENGGGDDDGQLKLTFNLCLNLIELTDRFMLFDIKKFLCLFLILNYFSKCTLIESYLFSLKFNCEFLTNACLDYLLASNNNTFVEFIFFFKSLISISKSQFKS
jgi:hypothetical protein